MTDYDKAICLIVRGTLADYHIKVEEDDAGLLRNILHYTDLMEQCWATRRDYDISQRRHNAWCIRELREHYGRRRK